MQGLGHQLFAAARLAGDHHGHMALAQATNGPKHILHGWGLAQHFRGSSGPNGAHLLVLAFFHRAPNQLHRFGQVKGFGQVFKSPTLKGRYGAVEVGKRGHDDDR